MFNFKESSMLHFSSFVCYFSRFLCSLLVPIPGTRRAAHSSQDWDHEKGYLPGFLSVAPFNDSFQCQQPCMYDYPFCCNWWDFILCNGWVIILLKICKPDFLLIKYPSSARDFGPPRPSFCLHSLQSVEAYQAHFLARAFKTSLRGCPVRSWEVQVLCVGFIGFPRNPRDTTLSLLFPLSFHQLRSTRPRSVKKTTSGAQTRTWNSRYSGKSDWDLLRSGKCRVMGQMAGKPHHFSTLLHHLFKVQRLSVSHQQIEAYLQMVENYLDCNNCNHLILAVCSFYL